MKRFDFAGEVAKQQITIGSALITVIVTFYKDLFSKTDYILSVWVLISIIAIFMSIIFGIQSIGGLTYLIERQEKQDYFNDSEKFKIITTDGFISNMQTFAQRFAVYQQIFFLGGFFVFVTLAFFDRTELFPHVRKYCGIPFKLIRAIF